MSDEIIPGKMNFFCICGLFLYRINNVRNSWLVKKAFLLEHGVCAIRLRRAWKFCRPESLENRSDFIHLQYHVFEPADYMCICRPVVVLLHGGERAGEHLCGERPGDRPPDAAAGGLCRRRSCRAGAAGHFDRFAGAFPHGARARRNPPTVGFVRGL